MFIHTVTVVFVCKSHTCKSKAVKIFGFLFSFFFPLCHLLLTQNLTTSVHITKIHDKYGEVKTSQHYCWSWVRWGEISNLVITFQCISIYIPPSCTMFTILPKSIPLIKKYIYIQKKFDRPISNFWFFSISHSVKSADLLETLKSATHGLYFANDTCCTEVPLSFPLKVQVCRLLTLGLGEP